MIKVRAYKKTDAAELAAIYFNTIHIINIHDYSEAQVNVWAPEKSKDPQGWMVKWEKIPPLVAVINEQPVGFAEFEPSGHIDCFYVHHEYQGHGIGSLLMQSIFNKAQKRNINRIFAEVSTTARPFFESKGFRVVRQQTIVRQGVELKNFVMERISNFDNELRSHWEEYHLKGDHLIFGVHYKDGSQIKRIECAENNNYIYEFPALILWVFYLNTALDFENRAILLSNLHSAPSKGKFSI